MSDEARIEEEKKAVASLKSAQANMAKAIKRIESLEYRLEIAARRLDEAASQVTGFQCNSSKTMRDLFKSYAADAREVL